MSNPFASNKSATATPNESPANHTPTAVSKPNASPFGADASGAQGGKGIELAPCPVGVLRGTTVALRPTAKGYALDVHCDDPAYPSKENVGIWIGNDTRMLLRLAGALGITADVREGKVYFTDDQGNVDESAFKNKPGLFIFCPYQGGPSINKFGLPKKGSSDEWDQYMDEANFSEDQIAALKKSQGGAVPGDLHHLFD